MSETVLGIDPGVNGALAVLHNGRARVHDVPVEQVKTGRTKRKRFLERQMWEIVRGIRNEAGTVVAAIEDVGPNPSFSALANHALGRGAALWEMALIAAGIPFERVRPYRWKATVGIARGADKGAARIVAQELFPDLYDSLKRVSDHDRADALLIAEWRRRQG